MKLNISRNLRQQEIELLLNNSFEARVRDIKEAIAMAQDALGKANNPADHILQAYCNTYLGYYHMILGQHDKASEFTLAGQSIFEQENIKEGLALGSLTIGSSHYKTDNYHKALIHLLNSYQLYQDIGDMTGQSRTLKAVGSIYEFLEDYVKAEETYKKCIEISLAAGDKNGTSNAYNPLSGLLLKRGELVEALSIIKHSIRLKEETQDERGLGFSYYGMAKVFIAKKDFEQAAEYLDKSIIIHQSKNESVGAMMALNKLGLLYFYDGAIEKAREVLLLCIEKGKSSNHYLISYKAFKLLYKIEKQENNIDLALRYLESHIQHKEKVVNLKTKNVISSIQSISKLEYLEKETKWQKDINTEIERKNKELDSFVYKVSHDLRGPISSLMGLNDLVVYEVTDPKSLEYFKIYNTQMHRLNNILMDFMNLVQLKEKELKLEPIDFNGMVNTCIQSFSYHKNFKSIEFRTNISRAIDFHSDKSTVTSIVQNLIENAIKYTNQEVDSIIEVAVKVVKAHVVLKVTDNGLGIKEDHQTKIFDMFFRAHSDINGTGLGLYILKSAVDKLEGNISLVSKEKEGSSFSISLPLDKRSL